MTGVLSGVLGSSTKLKPSVGAEEAMRSVEELAKQQSQAPPEAAQFSPVVGLVETGVSCSFTFNPVADTVDFESSNALEAAIRKHEGGFKVSIRF